ncbi:MAG: hypothetical protein KF752_05235 [Pirellulaceae bacterium]|nr:hypothetical protein [Pirellulaceae bacterium]
MFASIRALLIAAFIAIPVVQAQVPPTSFVNYENAPIHGLDLSPDGSLLAAVNTSDMRVEVFSLDEGLPALWTSIAVGLEPVSVRFRTNAELWVVNNLSDSITIINVTTGNITHTIATLNDPWDVVFAGSPERAFVSCGLPRAIQVFNPSNVLAAPSNITLQGLSPRAMAVSSDRSQVYAAFFHSGNCSTLLAGGATSLDNGLQGTFPPDIVTNPAGPYNGLNPPPNAGAVFNPPRNIAAGTPPRVALIVRQDAQGVWRDDAGTNWSPWVDGANASASGRYPGWTLIDNDVAVVNASSLAVSYVTGLMNLCMSVSVNPATGQICVVGTDARNEIRFEPLLRGQFIEVLAAFANPATLQSAGRFDLNAPLVAQFTGATLPATERAKAIGDPRAIVWSSSGSQAYVAGMGSGNVIAINSAGQRVGQPIPVREGPAGLALDESRSQLYVLNRFDGSVSVINLTTGTESAVVRYFDPTPAEVRNGRRHLYNTHEGSAVGQIACASCHVDGRMDRLAWDLGDPSGDTVPLSQRDLNVQALFELTDFHPMKGPMTTQTLQDIIGHEPLHWRGDRFGIEEFNGAFSALQGRDTGLTTLEMAEFKSFLATLTFPPNPFRNLNNALPTSLNLSGHFATGRFTRAAGVTLPNGNAVNGLSIYRSQSRLLDAGALACVTCHTLPSGGSTERTWDAGLSRWVTIPRGPHNENHLAVMGVDPTEGHQSTIKVPQMRNLHEKVGFEMTPGNPSLSGFGLLHDGSIPSLSQFVALGPFRVQSDQEVANLVALLLAWSGSDFGVTNNGTNLREPPGVFSKDSHAAVGQQETIRTPTQSTTRLNSLVSIVNGAPGRLQLIAKAHGSDRPRGFLWQGGVFVADNPGQQATQAQLVAATGNGNTVTFTVVPAGTGQRLGIDRDMDGYLDYQEFLNCTDPDDPTSFGTDQCSQVLTGKVYYNQWQGDGSPVDAAKSLFKAGATSTPLGLANLVNCATGLTGVNFEVVGLGNPAGLTATDFRFQVSPHGAFSTASNPPTGWEPAPAPSSVTVAAGSPDQILILWPDNSIVDRWLRITIKANANTGLMNEEVYYIGHLCGETSGIADGMYTVSFADISPIRAGVGADVDSSSLLDIDKNGIISFADIAAMRAKVGNQLTNISVP